MTLKKVLCKFRDFIIYGIASTALAFLISLIISKYYGKNLYTTMGIIGVIIAVIGALSLGHGNPTLSGMANLSRGTSGQAYATYLNMEVTREERRLTNYYNDIKNHAQFYFKSGGLNVLVNGIIVFIASILLEKLF